MKKYLISRAYKFGCCEVIVFYDRPYCATIFPDGHLVAEPHTSPDYESRAHDLGYASAEDMNREHDPLHSYLAYKLGHPWSETLHAAAHDVTLPKGVIPREEAMVLSFQRLMNCGMNGCAYDALWPLRKGHDLEELAQEARELFR